MNKATSGLAALLLIGTVGCVELDVQNPNDPDAARALATPEDTESLIGGGFLTFISSYSYYGSTMFLSAASFEHTAPWANAGMEIYARIPRVPTQNVAGGSEVAWMIYAWEQSYAAINQVASGLYSIESGEVDLGTEGNLRAQAWGKYVLGLAHGTVALVYDSGFVFDEDAECLTTSTCGSDPADVPLQGYAAVMTAALGYLDEAANLSSGASFIVPASWARTDVPAATLEDLARSERARMRANVARTPAERAAVDWTAVRNDVAAGVTVDWDYEDPCSSFGRGTAGECQEGFYLRSYPGWSMMPMWIIGMADQSGGYQTWINTPTADKREFVSITPDLRFPQGADDVAQQASPGVAFRVGAPDAELIGRRPDRGTWRWSHYKPYRYEPLATVYEGAVPMYTVNEMNALIAEADYRAGTLGPVATYINNTRTTYGLAATDAGGTNTDCVPRMPPTHPTNPNGCGDLWEMFKWEKRMETQFVAAYRSGWWLDGRGWGDLMEGTILQLPVPYREMQLLQQQPYNTGGVGGNSAASVGAYGY
jgi:hypothetical protein